MISLFDLFSIGIGPSSSHTVGPMRAAHQFVDSFSPDTFRVLTHITVEVYGSLAHTGIGHGTDRAILMGLEGELPESIDPDSIDGRMKTIAETDTLTIKNKEIKFNKNLHFIFNKTDLLPIHPNAMRFKAFDSNGNLLASKEVYSVGGGFIVDGDETQLIEDKKTVPYPFKNTLELLAQCKEHNLTIAELMLKNESHMRSEEEVKERLRLISKTMGDCIEKGCQTDGILPGGLNVKRRAPALHQQLQQRGKPASYEHTDSMNWLNMFALAVNEENAAGGRVVTAPTNGAAGIMPAVLHYYMQFYPDANEAKTFDFLLTAGAIAILFKMNASISGAEVGCQGEVGVASSMAAAGLASVLGGSLGQIENAAEIAIEHHLGLTCDPIAGLVQIPCIERNAMGAVKAVNAVRLAMAGDGTHFVPLDKAILTMKKTGEDMNSIYKETSLGGLAANIIEC